MELKALYCPACGGQIKVNLGYPLTYCQYCGTQLHSDGVNLTYYVKTVNHNYNYHYRDDSRIKEAEVKQKELSNQAMLTPLQLQQQERIRMKELEVKEKKSDNKAVASILIGFWVIIAVITIFII